MKSHLYCVLATIFAAATIQPVGAVSPTGTMSTVNLAEPPSTLDTSPMPVEVVEAYPNLRISRPIVMTGAGDGSGRLYVASQTGEVFVFDESETEIDEAELFIDLSDRVSYKDKQNEEGFLGLAFHPEFSQNGRFVVYYSTSDRPHVSIISEFRTTTGDGQGIGDPTSERELMTIQQPFWNHNGGTLTFGPDGYLYIALGDGGKGDDPLKSGQDLSKLLGSVLRIDVNATSEGKPYGIPADNPLVGRANVWPEIYAWGIRNIWRMSFDSATGDLWAADVGQNAWEEVNRIELGGNYGWSLREANHKFTRNGNKGSDARADLIDPIVEYPHTEDWGRSVTGGCVYRGNQTPSLTGHYLYGDYVSGRLWALKIDESGQAVANRPIAWDQLPVFTFGQTDSGEVLMSTMMGGGRIYKFAGK